MPSNEDIIVQGMALVPHPEAAEKTAAGVRRLSIHRCRFMNYEPRPVVAMASSRAGDLIAVARESGNVEIRRMREKLRVIEVVQIGKEGHVRALAWSRHAGDGARLFAAGLDATVCEVDVNAMGVTRRRDSFGGAVWCLAAAAHRDLLAVGCEDGSVKLFSTADGGLEYERSLPVGKSRVLSVAWQPGDEGLFVGAVDGTIRQIDPATGHSNFRMTVESRNNLGPSMVWALKVLRDGTVVSGDSTGSVHFWDGRMGTLQQSFSVHEADVLAVEAWEDKDKGDVVFAAGVDSKLVCMRRDAKGTATGTGPWVVSASNRAHTHDVTGLVTVTHLSVKGEEVPLLLSGGKDTKICSYNIGEFAISRPRYIAPYPYQRVGSLARECPSRLFLMRHDRKLHLWRLAPEDPIAAMHNDPAPVLEVQVPADKGNVVCAALSLDGRHLAYATAKDTRVFTIKETGLGISSHVELRKVPGGLTGMEGVTVMEFTPDGKRLVVGTCKGAVAVMEVDSGEVVRLEPSDGEDEEEEGTKGKGLTMLSCSANSKHVAIGRLNGTLEVLRLSSSKGLKVEWTLPRLDSPATALAFHCRAHNVLAVACVSNRFYLFDTATRGLTDWSKDMGHRLPPELLERHDCIVGMCFNPGLPNSILLYGFGFVCYVDLDKPPVARAKILPENHPAALQQQADLERKKRKREGSAKEKREKAKAAAAEAKRANKRAKEGKTDDDDYYGPAKEGAQGEEKEKEKDGGKGGDQKGEVRENAKVDKRRWNVQMHLGYQGVLAVEAMGQDELVLVEEPWIKIVNKLPDVLFRSRYGT